MRKFLQIILFAILATTLQAQYSTPGTGINWTFDDLAENSAGAVSQELSGSYIVHEDLTISAGDTLHIFVATNVLIENGILVTIQGTLIADPPDNEIVFFKARDDHYTGFRFEDHDDSFLKNVYFKKAGGIKLINADIVFESCDFTEFNQNHSTGTVDLFQSDPLIINCSFTYNNGPAVMSGANGGSSPQIMGCDIFHNVQQNGNTPQINLGTSGSDSIRIINNVITGSSDNTMAGGIAITTLAGGSIEARIEGNVIDNNRYGITAYGYDIGSVIKNNEITNNNTQNIPMQGGSGINFWGDASNQSMVTGNFISGNLWGITIQNNARPNIGDLEGPEYNPGVNQIYGNGNNGENYDLYNNTPEDIMAENNYWGTSDPDTAEMHIFHQPDDPQLGLVDFLPMYDPPVSIRESRTGLKGQITVFPNPASDAINIDFSDTGLQENLPANITLNDMTGRQRIQQQKSNITQGISLDLSEIHQWGWYLLSIDIKGNKYSRMIFVCP